MGLLFVPTTAGDTVSADPYFANCPAHMDKTEMKARRRAYEKMEKTAFLKQKAKAAKPLNNREKLKLERKQQRMKEMKNSKPTPWLPTTEKWPRLLHTNAEVVRGMMLKAKLHNMSIGEGTDCAEGAHISRIDFAAAKASGKAISVPLSLSADFIAYYSQRETDIQELRHQLEHLKSKNEKLKAQQNHKLQGVCEYRRYVASFFIMPNNLFRLSGKVSRFSHSLNLKRFSLSVYFKSSIQWVAAPKLNFRLI